MSCSTCIFLTNAAKGAGCSQQYACNPHWNGKDKVGKIITESICGTCNQPLKQCQCTQGDRKVKTKLRHVA